MERFDARLEQPAPDRRGRPYRKPQLISVPLRPSEAVLGSCNNDDMCVFVNSAGS